MDDDWGYSYDLGHPHIGRRITLEKWAFPAKWGYPKMAIVLNFMRVLLGRIISNSLRNNGLAEGKLLQEKP